jgi:hypothetical protein
LDLLGRWFSVTYIADPQRAKPRSDRRRLTVFAAVAVVAFTVISSAGAGGAPSIAFSPSSGVYGPIDSGTTASQTFTLTNSGGAATGALTVSLTGASAFSTTADTCTAASLGPQKSCSVTVQYAPTSEGASESATLSVMGKKSAAVASASLTGASTSPPTYATSRADCESFGGTFSTGTGATLWTCNGWLFTSLIQDFNAKVSTLGTDCTADDGGSSADSENTGAVTANTTCNA